MVWRARGTQWHRPAVWDRAGNTHVAARRMLANLASGPGWPTRLLCCDRLPRQANKLGTGRHPQGRQRLSGSLRYALISAGQQSIAHRGCRQSDRLGRTRCRPQGALAQVVRHRLSRDDRERWRVHLAASPRAKARAASPSSARTSPRRSRRYRGRGRWCRPCGRSSPAETGLLSLNWKGAGS
jgi:hypothetical protein